MGYSILRRKGNKMPCDYSKYPENWEWIRSCILARAGNRCELCGAENGKPHWKTGSKVVLTIAHLDQDRENNKKYNLAALCQRCHNKIDLPYRIKRRKERNMKTENIEISYSDILIKGLGERIVKGVRDYIKENHIEKSEIEIDIKIVGSNDPCKIEVLITILRRRQKARERPIRPERMDYMEKGATIGKPREYNKIARLPQC